MNEQKQSSRAVLRKKRSENMQQIYRRIPMPKCHFNKDANLSESHFGVSVLLYIFAEYLWGAASE